MPLVPLSRKLPSADYPVDLVILGSTGSIGSSALEIVRRYPERFRVFALVAGSNEEKLFQQANEFRPKYAALSGLERVSRAFPCELLLGAQAVSEIARHPEVDLVLAAIVGIAGLAPVISALGAGKRIALANKESLVCAGALIASLVQKHHGVLLPVDSEHSAIWQALQGEQIDEVERLVLTASGGPLLNTPLADLRSITPEQAVAHPRWNMGAKISVDSATLVNKALELIEAHYLFDFAAERIDVLVHPQSIVHSLVEFCDGSQLAQLSQPDMKGAIGYAMNYPCGRLGGLMTRLDLSKLQELRFFELNNQRFPAVALARQALRAGGATPAVFSIANELAVSGFLKGKLTFDRLFPVVERTCEQFVGRSYNSLDELLSLRTEIEQKIQL